MGIKSFNPYTPSRRHMTSSDFNEITKSTPEKSLEGVYGLKLLIPITLFSFHFVSHLCVHISNSC